jgi:hypothetical protein
MAVVFVPSMLGGFLAACEGGVPLGSLFVGGEALTEGLAQEVVRVPCGGH